MPNRIFYNPDGYVEAVIEGDQTAMSFENLRYDAEDLLEQMTQKGQPRLGLIDISQERNFTNDSNKAAMQILESLNYDRLAIFGAKKFQIEITNAIILAMGKSANTKLFPDRQTALAWLQAP